MRAAMLDLANDIRSLSDFKRNTVELLDRLRKTRHPLVLTIQRESGAGRARRGGLLGPCSTVLRLSRGFNVGWPM